MAELLGSHDNIVQIAMEVLGDKNVSIPKKMQGSTLRQSSITLGTWNG